MEQDYGLNWNGFVLVLACQLFIEREKIFVGKKSGISWYWMDFNNEIQM